MTSLVIPLRREHFRAFEDGSKQHEYRRYGPRWNEETCRVGLPATLSLGYGKSNRRTGVIAGFDKRHGSTFDEKAKADINSVYDTLDVEIACIYIPYTEALT